ncbi:hypothetical protein [uncultured Sphingomonas sp.]|uniref:hypothetical protein n=1 Tax=uncultured Sphingomonas sp. TaxID=158754 RepID=UPI0025F1FEC9|nr:hypothetical protein [uncultured Sphingomonas sp.]
MVDFSKWKNSRTALGIGAAVLLGVGAAGGAGAVQATRPSVEMAPTVATPIARLSATSGVVTVKGRVAEVYGDRFVVQDTSGRAMVAAGREGRGAVGVGQPVTVQGHFDEGQLRASYIVDAGGQVAAVGPREPGPGGMGPHRGPGRDGPPPPPPGCGPAPAGPAGPGAPPPPPPPPPGVAGAPAAGPEGAPPPPPGAAPVAPGERPAPPPAPAPAPTPGATRR